jgi:hypothetical protein
LLGASPAGEDEQPLCAVNYEEKENQILKILTEQAQRYYWHNLVLVAIGEKLQKKFKDQALEDRSESGGRYTQNLQGYRSFFLRKDPMYNRRKVKNPLEESRAIICLYTRNDDVIMLCNIGKPDDVYTEDPLRYQAQ